MATLRCSGPFALLRQDGTAATPTTRKAGALLALLALSPGMKRTRLFLQEQLWSSRAPAQASASLRQALSEIRRLLGPERGAVRTSRREIALDPAHVTLALDDVDRDRTLLEGLDLPNERFQQWLNEHRAAFAEGRSLPNLPRSSRDPPRNTLLLVAGRGSANPDTALRIDAVLDMIGQSVNELGVARVVDHRESPRPVQGRALKVLSEASSDGRMLRLALVDMGQGELVWRAAVPMPGAEVDPVDPVMLHSVHQGVIAAVRSFTSRFSMPDEALAWAKCQEGVRLLFALGKENCLKADTHFAEAQALDPSNGIYPAWRAYQRTFLVAERYCTNRPAVEEEAFGLLARAFELSPDNSYVAALAAHVHSILRRSYVAAYELAERSVQINRANPIGWACFGIAKCYLGLTAEGLSHTNLARRIAGTAPYRFQIDALNCIAAAMAGDIDTAIHAGEASHALAPGFAAPLRYLAALHLHKRSDADADRAVQHLRLLEPAFRLDDLLDDSYPAAGLRRTPILKSIPKREL